MRILVTGGTGEMGRAVVCVLAEAGHELTLLGRRRGMEVPGTTYHAGDICDFSWLSKRVAGHDAVVHLAAAARPSIAPPAELFSINAGGTFNVFQAAADAGIRRVVQAGSVNAIGLFFSTEEHVLQGLPLTEQHPGLTTDPYSFSKTVNESVGAYFSRRDGISGVALRLPWITSSLPVAMRDGQRQVLEKMAGMEVGERAVFLAGHLDRYAAWRRDRRLENECDFELTWSDGSPLGAETRDLVNGRYNLFAAVHELDAAEAVRAAVETDYDGFHPVFATDSRNWLGHPSRDLAELLYPNVPLRRVLSGDDSLIDCERARALLGWEATRHLADL